MEHIKIKMSPKDFFLYIGAMVTLYISVFSLLALLFQYIEVLFPDQLDFYRDPYSSGIRFQIASLIVIFPVYLFITRMLNRELKNTPEKKELGIRKWLIYLTLFIAGATVLIDLIVLLNTFLGGELTTRFVLKVLAVLAVVGNVFSYYFFDLKGRWEANPHAAKMIAWAVSLVVFISVAGGFFIMGSPQTQRLFRFDREKINDLQGIQRQIVNYWQQKESLPEDLSLLEDSISGFRVPIDSQTGGLYTYNITDTLSFELCAEFNEKSQEFNNGRPRVAFPQEKFIGLENTNWEHGIGETCFSRTIDPDLYPTRRESIPVPIR